MKKEKLIYIYPKKSTFIAEDIAFLEKNYAVKTQDLIWTSPLKLPFNFIAQFFFLLRNVKNTKAIIISFAGYFSFLPTLLGKLFNLKVFIILNGTECVSFPRYNYGSLRKPILRFFIEKSLKNASKLFPVDASLVFKNHNFDDAVQQKKQGFKHYFPNLKTPYTIIPNGFNTNFWKAATTKKSGFITVAFIDSMTTFKFKGIDLFIAMANCFPKENFTIIGISNHIKNQLSNIPKNVTIIASVDKNQLKTCYAQHNYYVQLSINEGFGCALAEAMLCECIPIVAKTGALKNIIGITGFLVEKRNIEVIVEVFSDALAISEAEKNQLQQNARERIVNNFDISIRENLILQEIQN